jgi:hypothetical protein
MEMYVPRRRARQSRYSARREVSRCDDGRLTNELRDALTRRASAARVREQVGRADRLAGLPGGKQSQVAYR